MPFRILAGMFFLLALSVPAVLLVAWWRGTPAPDVSMFAGLGGSIVFALLSCAFGWVAITGRLPRRLYELLRRSS